MVGFDPAASIADIADGLLDLADGIETGLTPREAARLALARARTTSASVPDFGTLADLWPTLAVEERRHVLRGSLGAVWVRKGRGPASERVRVVAAGHGPARSNGRHVLEPLDWDADLEGEIGPTGA